MKNCRHGQAAILSNVEYNKLRRQIKQYKYKIMLDIAWYTGERWGAIVQLMIHDIYDVEGKVKPEITFRASTRKKRANGTADTRQIPIHPALKEALESFEPESSIWMFPGKGKKGHTCWRNAYNILMAASVKCGLARKGVSTHSTRRSFITKLHQQGISPAVIKQITGHQDIKSLERYIDVSRNEIRGAIANL